MYQQYSRTGWFGAIAILFIYTNAYAISYFDPYKLAENSITETISENHDIIERLEVYGQQAKELREKIEPAVGPSRSVVEHKDFLTTGATTLKIKGGAIIVESVYLIAQQILIIDEELGKISTSSDLSMEFARLIESDSYLGKDEHKTIMAHVNETKSGLLDAHDELQTLSERLRTLFSNPNYKKIRISLCIIPELCNALQAWEGLPGNLDQTLEKLDSDINTLEIINSKYDDLAARDKGLTSFLLRPLSQWIISSKIVLFTFLIFLTGGIYGVVRTPSTRQSWSNWISKSKNAITGKLKYQVYPNGFSKPTSLIINEKSSKVKNNHCTMLSLTRSEKNRQKQALLVCNFPGGERYILGVPDTGNLTIGSNTIDDVFTSSSGSAKSQVMLKHAITVFYLEVLDCSFPTKLNGQIITGGRKLNTGDVIALGNLSAVYLENK